MACIGLDIRGANFWLRLRGTFWFIPSLIATLAVALAFFMLAIDQEVRYRDIEGSWWWIFS